MRVKIAAILCVGLIMSGCTGINTKPSKESKKMHAVSLHKVYDFKLNPGDDRYLGRLRTDFQVNIDNDRLAFYDETFKHIIVTDTLGTLKTVMGKEGRGPGEFVKVSAYSFSDNGDVYVFDSGKYELMHFSPSGSYLDAVLLEPLADYSLVGRFMASTGGRFYFPVIETKYLGDLFNSSPSPQIVELDSAGRLLSAFAKYDSLVSKSMSSDIFPLLNYERTNKVFYTARPSGSIVQGWDLNTRKRVYFADEMPSALNFGSERIRAEWPINKIKEKSIGLSGVFNLYKTQDYVVLHFETLTEAWFATSDSDKKEQYIALYDNEGRLVGEKKLDHRLAGVVNNRLYLILDDNPDNYTLGVYELEVD